MSQAGKIPKNLVVAASAWVGRVVAILCQLVAVRAILGAMGVGGYAAFALLGSLVNWYLLCDLGVGASLQNHISECRVRNEPYEGFVRAASWAGLVQLLGAWLLVLLLAPVLGPRFLEGFPSLAGGYRAELFLASGLLHAGAAVGSIAYKVWYAEQRGYLANLVPALSAVAGLGGILAVVASGREDRLLLAVLAYQLPSALLALASLAKINLRGAKPPPFRELPFGALLRRGWRFWGFGILAALVLSIDTIVISQTLPPREIVAYTLVYKIFDFPYFVYNAFLLALWPVFSEAMAAGRFGEVRRQARFSLSWGAAGMVLFTALILLFIRPIVSLLSPNDPIEVPVRVILLFGGYMLVRIWSDTFAVVLQSRSHLSPLWRAVVLQAAVGAALQLWLGRLLGATGIVLALAAAFCLTVAWMLPLAVRKSLSDPG